MMNPDGVIKRSLCLQNVADFAEQLNIGRRRRRRLVGRLLSSARRIRFTAFTIRKMMKARITKLMRTVMKLP